MADLLSPCSQASSRKVMVRVLRVLTCRLLHRAVNRWKEVLFEQDR